MNNTTQKRGKRASIPYTTIKYSDNVKNDLYSKI
jgi:hypothetical protein